MIDLGKIGKALEKMGLKLENQAKVESKHSHAKTHKKKKKR